MFYRAISQCAQMLKNSTPGSTRLNSVQPRRTFCIDILLTGRLAPDQKPFIYQVQSADYVKAGAAWLSGQIPPKHEDNEKAIEEVRARIKKTVAFVDSVKEEQYGGPRAVE